MEAHELRPMPGSNSCQGQPPARKLVRYLREDQVRKKKEERGHQVLDRTKALHGPRTQAYGETKYKKNENYKCRTEPRPCMVLGLKPMGKPSIKNRNYKCWTVPRPCMVLGIKPTGKPTGRIKKKVFGLRNMGYWIKRSGHFIHGLNTLKG